MIKQIVIDKITKEVKRWGYCDFSNDGSFDEFTEEIIEKDFLFLSEYSDIIWYYDTEEDIFYYEIDSGTI